MTKLSLPTSTFVPDGTSLSNPARSALTSTVAARSTPWAFDTHELRGLNGALDSFVRAAAVELTRGVRISVVSPTVITESMADYGPSFRGFEAVPASRVALAYAKSVEGAQTG